MKFTISTHPQGHSLPTLHYQCHYQFPKTCTMNFTISPYHQGFTLSTTLSIAKTCTIHFTVIPISKDIHYNFPISFRLQGMFLQFRIDSHLERHPLSKSQSVPISMYMHCLFQYQFPSQRACTIILTVHSRSKAICYLISLSVSISKNIHYQVHCWVPSPRAYTFNFTVDSHLQGYALSTSL